MPNYFGITIGPIDETLAVAKKTRELWVASYMYSYLMFLISQEIKSDSSLTILLPQYGGGDNSPPQDVGLLPDRMIIHARNGDLKEAYAGVKEKVENAVNDLVILTGNVAIKDYMIRNIVGLTLKEGENIVFEINNALDASEQMKRLSDPNSSQVDQTVIKLYDELKIYRKGTSNPRFPSIAEISTYELQRLNGSAYDKIRIEQIYDKEKLGADDADDFINELRSHPSFKDQILQRNKYIAVVYADGDNMGQVFGEIGKQEDNIQKVSKELTAFAESSAAIIDKYGGHCIYAGGDDLLFLAPVAVTSNNGDSEKEVNIFGLCKVLKANFKKAVVEKTAMYKLKKEPSLSFGVFMFYYKFPLQEALEKSRQLLFKTAKKYPGKDTIAFELEKHSGQRITGKYKAASPLYKDLAETKEKKLYEASKALNSVQYKLKEQEFLFKQVLADKTMLEHFFENTFNEDIHKKNKAFMDTVCGLIHKTYTLNQDIDQTLADVFGYLRFNHFIQTSTQEDR